MLDTSDGLLAKNYTDGIGYCHMMREDKQIKETLPAAKSMKD
jgi:hypothetical protein